MKILLISLSLLWATTGWAEPLTLTVTSGVLQERQDVSFAPGVSGPNFSLGGFTALSGAVSAPSLANFWRPVFGQPFDQSGPFLLTSPLATITGQLCCAMSGTVQLLASPALPVQIQGDPLSPGALPISTVTSPFTLSGIVSGTPGAFAHQGPFGEYRVEGTGIMTSEFWFCGAGAFGDRCGWNSSRLEFGPGAISESLLVVHAPEPTTWALLVTGLMGLTLRRRAYVW